MIKNLDLIIIIIYGFLIFSLPEVISLTTKYLIYFFSVVMWILIKVVIDSQDEIKGGKTK